MEGGNAIAEFWITQEKIYKIMQVEMYVFNCQIKVFVVLINNLKMLRRLFS